MKTLRGQIYGCERCANVLSVVTGGGPVPMCCGLKMEVMTENTTDAAVEKHVPVVKKVDGGYNVLVGGVDHPMGDDHYIDWIELVTEDRSYFHYLSPNEKPETFFAIEADTASARAHCNLHGLWKG